MQIYYVMTIEAEEANSDAKRLNEITRKAQPDTVRDRREVKEFLFADMEARTQAHQEAVRLGFRTAMCITVPEFIQEQKR